MQVLEPATLGLGSQYSTYKLILHELMKFYSVKVNAIRKLYSILRI